MSLSNEQPATETTVAEPGSFRDRSGRIFYHNGDVYRTVMPSALPDFEAVRATGLIGELVDAGLLTAETRHDATQFDFAANAALVLQHPRLPFVSYPYEWTFSELKSAALLHLDIQLRALEKGVVLSDASAYNLQLIDTKPVFIDNLSFRPYREGEYWGAHRQFCEQFLNPLLLWSHAGIAHNALFRGNLDGISAQDMSRILPWRCRLSWTLLTHIYLQARLQRRSDASADAAKRSKSRPLPRLAYQEMLRGLRNWMSKLESAQSRHTVWNDYADNNSYQSAESGKKRDFVAAFCAATQPALLFDIGCNSGDYSALALQHGATRVVGFDFDHGALEQACARARKQQLAFTPCWLDATNPSPDLGWMEAERRGFGARARGDAVLALALIHHLAIAGNIPLDQAINWIVDRAPAGVIEFVPKSDPMVKRLLQLRDDIFDDYDQATFEKALKRRADIVKSVDLAEGGRTLFWYEEK